MTTDGSRVHRLYVPLPDLGDAWLKTVSLANVGIRPARIMITAYAHDGHVVGLRPSYRALAEKQKITLEPSMIPKEASLLVIDAPIDIVALVLIHRADGKKAEAFPALSDPATQLNFPLLMGPEEWLYKTIELISISSSFPSIEIQALDKDGMMLDRTLLSRLYPYALAALTPRELFTSDQLNQTATLRVVAETELIGLQYVNRPDVDVYGLPGLSPEGRNKFRLPVMVDAGGHKLWTSLSLLNPGEKLSFFAGEAFDANGISLGVIERGDLLPGGQHILTFGNKQEGATSNVMYVEMTADQPIQGYAGISAVESAGRTMLSHTTNGSEAWLELIGSRDGQVLLTHHGLIPPEGPRSAYKTSLGEGSWLVHLSSGPPDLSAAFNVVQRNRAEPVQLVQQATPNCSPCVLTIVLTQVNSQSVKGTVRSVNVLGINCTTSGGCQHDYNYGTKVTLQAFEVANSGSNGDFRGFDCGSGLIESFFTTTVEMTAHNTCTAKFGPPVGGGLSNDFGADFGASVPVGQSWARKFYQGLAGPEPDTTYTVQFSVTEPFQIVGRDTFTVQANMTLGDNTPPGDGLVIKFTPQQTQEVEMPLGMSWRYCSLRNRQGACIFFSTYETQIMFQGVGENTGAVPNEQVHVWIEASSSTISEGGSGGKLVLTRVGPLGNQISVNRSLSGTALAGTDYRILDGTTNVTGSTFTIPANSVQHEFDLIPINNCVAGSNKSLTVALGNSAPIFAVAPTSATVTITDDDGSNAVPTISNITDNSTNESTPTSAIAFTIGDAETAAGSLTLSKSSSNTTLVPNANIVFGGSGANRTVTVTPAANKSGTATITVTVTDCHGAVATDTFVLTVTAVNNPPVFDVIGDQTVNEDPATQMINITGVAPGPASATDETGQTVSVTATSSNTGIIPNPNVTGAGASRTLTYQPVADKNTAASGPVTITVMAQDNGGTANGGQNTFSRTFMVTINPVNDAPTANGQNLTTSEDTSKAITLTGSDPEGSSLTFTVLTNPTKGALSGTAPNLTYKPNHNQNGMDSFTFRVNDGTANSASATVSITITPVNDAPAVPSPKHLMTTVNIPVAVPLSGNDVESSVGNFVWTVGTPSHGTLSGTPPNLTYTPAPGYVGSDSFTYAIRDRGDPDNCGTPGSNCAAQQTSATATVNITVRALPTKRLPPLRTPLSQR